ncbi:hypothetical protein BDP81DRAFT_426373 [Colletotrichum phormii]|uniref:Uncharacterized protein n=1 Tax=Colletotrichum phormii TaxID=359342 RepID=A0AAI9ZRS6_9PEZI|nr:uncharacterized protein BDP81DRAFT_426373 [Colletotrichum phormii]KAK1636979.1 hypothetical protein BDP81DRAFT_426373 [Colletotrichum phormii]
MGSSVHQLADQGVGESNRQMGALWALPRPGMSCSSCSRETLVPTQRSKEEGQDVCSRCQKAWLRLISDDKTACQTFVEPSRLLWFLNQARHSFPNSQAPAWGKWSPGPKKCLVTAPWGNFGEAAIGPLKRHISSNAVAGDWRSSHLRSFFSHWTTNKALQFRVSGFQAFRLWSWSWSMCFTHRAVTAASLATHILNSTQKQRLSFDWDLA